MHEICVYRKFYNTNEHSGHRAVTDFLMRWIILCFVFSGNVCFVLTITKYAVHKLSSFYSNLVVNGFLLPINL